MKDLIFTNSYGQKTRFSARPAALLALKDRKPKHVGPEVLEALDRIFSATINGKGAEATATHLALELNVKPKVVKLVLSKLRQTGLVDSTQKGNCQIFRKPNESDYKVFLKE